MSRPWGQVVDWPGRFIDRLPRRRLLAKLDTFSRCEPLLLHLSSFLQGVLLVFLLGSGFRFVDILKHHLLLLRHSVG